MRPEIKDYCSYSDACRRLVKYFVFDSGQILSSCDICDTSLGLECDFGKVGLSQK